MTSAVRLLRTGAAHPAWNMAVDEVLLRGCLAGGMPTLRLYRWEPPGLSLGRFQRNEAGIDLEACRREKIPVVRRLTGGRGVLHHREVTYAVAARHGDLFPERGVLEVHRRLAEAVAEGLGFLGIECQIVGRGRGALPRAGDCFAAASQGEIVAGGRKLVGSAQVRESGGFLQHGSVPLSWDHGLQERVFPGSAAGRRAASLEDCLGRTLGSDEVEEALAAGFARRLGVELQPGGLSVEEGLRAALLAFPGSAGTRLGGISGEPGSFDE